MQLKEVTTPQPLIQLVEFTGVTPKTFISLSREPIAEGRHKYTPIKVGAKHTPDNYKASIISYSGMMYSISIVSSLTFLQPEFATRMCEIGMGKTRQGAGNVQQLMC